LQEITEKADKLTNENSALKIVTQKLEGNNLNPSFFHLV